MKKFSMFLAVIVSIAFICGTLGCTQGTKNGVDAYDVALRNGFKGTEAEWLESLKGKDGDNAQTIYLSLYDEAVEKYGYTGTFFDFVREYMGGASAAASDNSLSAAADRAVMSAVSIYAGFTAYKYNLRGDITGTSEFEQIGSGVIVHLDEERGDGYVVTNFHIIYSANDIDGYADSVKLYVYGREGIEKLAVNAEIVGAASEYDIAVLKVTNSEIFRTSNLIAAEFEDSNFIGAGDSIFTVGNPQAEDNFGLSLTAGVISVDSENIKMTSPKNNRSQVEYRVIRIDAAINGGNSGGALFDMNGKVVGIINSRIVSSSVENIAYAIPSAIAKRVYDNILENCDGTTKTIKRCLIGVTFVISNSYAYYDPILNDTRIKQEIKVESVNALGSAAGLLQKGDIIESFEYRGETVPVERDFYLTDSTISFRKGETVTVNVIRGGARVSVPVLLKYETPVE